MSELTAGNHQLTNGLEVLLITDPRARSITASLLGRRGPVHDPPGKPGLAHLSEHLFLSGVNYGGTAVGEPVEAVGGLVEGTTYRQHIRVELRTPLHCWRWTLEYLVELWRRGPSVKEIASERQALILECREAREIPELWVGSLAWDALGQDLAFRGFRSEFFDGVSKLSASDVENWTRGLGSDQWVLCVHSPCPESDLLEHISRLFNVDGSRGRPRTIVPHRPTAKRIVRLHQSKAAQSSVALLIASGAPTLRDIASGRVLCSLLSGGTQGLLFTTLRDKEGLVYDVVSHCVAESDILAIEVYTSINEGAEDRVTDLIRQQLEHLLSDGVDPSKLQRAKAFTNGVFDISLETPATGGRWLGNRYMSLGRIVAPEEWTESVEQVTPRQVNEFLVRSMESSDWVWAVSSPRATGLKGSFYGNAGAQVESVSW